MLFVSSTLLLSVNAVTFRRVRSIFFFRVASLTLVYSGVLWFDKLNIRFIILNCILPQTLKKINGSNRKENVLFFFNQIFNKKIYNRCISVLKSYLLIRFISLKMQLYNLFFGITLVNTGVIFVITLVLLKWFFGIWFDIDPVLFCAIISIKSYYNSEAEKATILKENKNKSGIYLWTNLINGKRYIGSAVHLSSRLSFLLF
jgi:hypothetical protein